MSQLRIAYLINQYPTISHSFIRREIHALERQGHTVLRISLHGWDVKLMNEAKLYLPASGSAAPHRYQNEQT